MRSKLFLALLILLTFATCTKEPRFFERSVVVGEQTYRYRVWLPRHYTKVHHWPVILYLHDRDARGDENARQLDGGLAAALQQYGERYKCIVVFPQCRIGEEWYGDMETQALAALDDAVHEYHGDRRRIYVTGIGMGGSGAWYFARHRRRFAAVVPVSGDVAHKDPFPSDPPPDIARIAGMPDPYAALAKEIGDTPVWVFHGEESRAMFNALQANGGRARYTQDADAAYVSPDVVKWLLKQRR